MRVLLSSRLLSVGLVDLDTSVTGDVVGIAGRLDVVSKVKSVLVFLDETVSEATLDEESTPIFTLELDSDDTVPDTEVLMVDLREALDVVTTTGEDVLDVVVYVSDWTGEDVL